jgi:hypothetical protein
MGKALLRFRKDIHSILNNKDLVGAAKEIAVTGALIEYERNKVLETTVVSLGKNVSVGVLPLESLSLEVREFWQKAFDPSHNWDTRVVRLEDVRDIENKNLKLEAKIAEAKGIIEKYSNPFPYAATTTINLVTELRNVLGEENKNAQS